MKNESADENVSSRETPVCRAILDTARDGILLISPDGIVDDANAAFTGITGIDRSDVKGRHAVDLARRFIEIHQLPQVLEKIARLLNGEPFLAFDIFYRARILEVVAPRRDSGAPYIVAYVRDVTELRNRSQTLETLNRDLQKLIDFSRTLLTRDESSDVYGVMAESLHKNLKTRLTAIGDYDEAAGVTVCRAFQGLEGLAEKIMALTGASPVGFTSPLPPEGFHRDSVKAGGLVQIPGGLSELTFGGIPVAAAAAIETLFDIGPIFLQGVTWKGNLLGIVVVAFRRKEEPDLRLLHTFTDLAAHTMRRLKAESERKSMQLQMEEARKLEAVGVLAGGIAHDFNNMLMALFGHLQVIKQRSAGQQALLEPVDRIFAAYARARTLTARLLTFSKGGMPVKRPDSLDAYIRDAVLAALEDSACGAVFKLPDDLWHCEVDEFQFRQAIENIVQNARHAMPAGGDILVKALNVPEGGTLPSPLKKGPYVRISVYDQGFGIRPEILPKIFDPFFSTKPDGVGLGLSAAYSIMRRHDGLVTAESPPGRGACFTVWVPALPHKTNRQQQ